MTGYIRGSLTDADGAAELLRTAEASVAAAARLGCPRLNLHGTGLDGQGLPVRPVTGEPTGPMWIAAGRTLTRLAELGRAGRAHLHPGEPQHHRGPPRRAVRPGRRHARAGRGGRTGPGSG